MHAPESSGREHKHDEPRRDRREDLAGTGTLFRRKLGSIELYKRNPDAVDVCCNADETFFHGTFASDVTVWHDVKRIFCLQIAS